jgi:hypothetical protein
MGNGRSVTGPISPPPVTDWRPDYLPAYMSNGLIGLRVGHIPLLYGVAMVSGFEGLDMDTGVEAFAQAPYPFAGDVRIGRTALSDPGRAVLREQRYDFSCGELLTHVGFDADDARVDIEIVSLCSRTQPTLALQEVRLRVDRDCDVAMSASLNAEGVPGSWAHQALSFRHRGDGSPYQGGMAEQAGSLDARPQWAEGPFRWRSPGELSSCGIAAAVEFLGADRFDISRHIGTGRLTKTYSFQARAGQRYMLRQMCSLVPQAVHSQPHMEAARLANAAQMRGFDELRRDNRAVWDELWQGRVVLVGAPARWQAFADAAYFYLTTSVHTSSPSATSVFGLAYWPNYHYYRGHLMWDIETFAVPPLLLTHPEGALGLLRYRGTRLPAARANAKITGYRGTQYPWESSLQHGHEASPIDSKGFATEQHVSMDIAIAFARYAHATGDGEFARHEAWPVLLGVAEWIESRVEKTSRGYEIRGVTGIAETGTTVDNSAFTNMAAATALREAIAFGQDLDLPYRRSWSTIAADLVIPVDAATRVIRSHDRYSLDEPQSATPEAPAGLFPVGFGTDSETERRTMEFYLRIADQYAGQPMLSSLLGVFAAWLGDRAASLDMFEKGYGEFIIEPYTITTEYSPTAFPDQPRAGPFTANLGGFLTSCLYGLTGLRLHSGKPTSWFERRVTLPQGWDAIHADRVWVRGEPLTLDAEHDAERGKFSTP